MLGASVWAFSRSLPRVALVGTAATVLTSSMIVSYLRLLPAPTAAAQTRMQAQLLLVCAVLYCLVLLVELLDYWPAVRHVLARLGAAAAAATLVGWALSPLQMLGLATAYAAAAGAVLLVLCVRSRSAFAWRVGISVIFLLAGLAGLSWISLAGEPVHWAVHAWTAACGCTYLVITAVALWARYAYLNELRWAMRHAPDNDPVTGLPSQASAGRMIGEAFSPVPGARGPIGMIAVSVVNLYALGNLHGRATLHHGLFVLGRRLRSVIPLGVEVGRLGEEGFLLLMREASDLARLKRLARDVAFHLSQPVTLSAGEQPAQLDLPRTTWTAEVGVGVLTAGPELGAVAAVAAVRGMSRSAWTYPSRIAWYDKQRGCVAELPATR
jgi:GGDEF domain-containing protein